MASSQVRTNVKITATSGDNELVAAVSGYKIRVLSFVLVPTGNQTAQFQSSTTSNLTGVMTTLAGTPIVAKLQREGLFETVSGEKLNLATSASTAAGHLTYCLIGA